MKHRKHHRVAKREAEVRNVHRLIRKEKKTIAAAVFLLIAAVWLEGFVIGALIGKKAGKRSTCV